MTKRIGVALLGMVAVYAWWSYRADRTPRHGPAAESIPEVVWDGGTPVAIQAELSHPGVVRAHFEKNHQTLEASQQLPAGHHTITVSVPEGTRGAVEVLLDDPEPGAKARVVVRSGSSELVDSSELKAALPPGRAFGARVDVADWASASLRTE